MAHISRDAVWTVPHGDFGALRLTSEVFLAQCGIRVEVRSGGTLIGKQGSSLRTCLFLIRLAPTRTLPKKARIDVIQEPAKVQLQVRFDSTFVFPKLTGLVARRYENQFSDWLRHLEGQIQPGEIIDKELADFAEAHANINSLTASGKSTARNGTGIAAEAGTASKDVASEAELEESNPGNVTADEQERDLVEEEVGGLPDEAELARASGQKIPPAGRPPGDHLPAANAADMTQEEAGEAPGLAEKEGLEAPLASMDLQAWASEPPEQSGTSARTATDRPHTQTEGPKRSWLRFLKFRLWNRVPKNAEATRSLSRRVSEEIRRGDELFTAESWTEAVLHFDAAIAALDLERNPESPDSGKIAQLYLRRGMARFRKNLASFAAPGQTMTSASDFQVAIESVRETIADYSEAIRSSSNWAEVFFRRGEARLFTARCERGRKRFRHASEDLNHAVADFTHTMELAPSFAAAYAQRGVAFSLLDRNEEADADIEKAIELGVAPAAIQQEVRLLRS